MKNMLNKDDFYLNLGKNIKKIREDKGLSLDEFSKTSGLGLNKSTISAIENGKQKLSIYQLCLIVENLDIKISDIINNPENELLNKNDLNKLENL